MRALPKSLWAATATPPASYPPLRGEVKADCVIVGGGFTGLSTALHLAERGIDAVLVEANEPGWGASGRNGGQVIPGLKLDPSELRAKYGEERGRRLTATVGATADLCSTSLRATRLNVMRAAAVGFKAHRAPRALRKCAGAPRNGWPRVPMSPSLSATK